MQKGQAVILVLVGILVIIGKAGGAYFFGKSQVSKPLTQNPVVVSQSPQATVSSTLSVSSVPNDTGEIANWETLSINEFGYILKYPADWRLSRDQHSNPLITSLTTFYSKNTCNIKDDSCSVIQVYVENNKNKNDLESNLVINLNGPKPDKVSNKTRIKVDGEEASEFDLFGTNYGSEGELIHTVVTNHHGRKYVISFSEGTFGGKSVIKQDEWKNKYIFDQILSTFKFIN